MRQLPVKKKNFESQCGACPQGMASRLENLAYVAEHDPARALQEYRRRMAARPQQVVHAPVTLAKQEKQSMSVATAEASCLLRVLLLCTHRKFSSSLSLCRMIRKQWKILRLVLRRPAI